MNITKSEIGLIKRMLEAYEKEVNNMDLSDFVKTEELQEIESLKKKIESDINDRRGKKGL